nr:thermonuclease family protein [uncultured Pseudodesulfovibrio sp.]
MEKFTPKRWKDRLSFLPQGFKQSQYVQRMRRRILEIIRVVSLFLLLAIPASAADVTLLEPGDRIMAVVLEVVDGDSLVVEVRGLRMPVRLAGVNCPEWDAPGGTEAKAFTAEWIARNPTLILEAAQDYYTKKPDCWDRFNRLLAWVWRDNHLLQEDMVRAGHAQVKWITEKDKHYKRLVAAERE